MHDKAMTTPNSKTPRSDAEKINHFDVIEKDEVVVRYSFARQLEQELEEAKTKASNLEQILRDECEDENKSKELAKKVLTEFQVEGDSNGVPSISDIVELLVDRICIPASLKTVDEWANELLICSKDRETLLSELTKVQKNAISSIHNVICLHHTDAQRQKIECPVCLTKERDKLKEQYQLFKTKFTEAVNACLFMHEDPPNGLQLGEEITTKGVTYLKQERDQLRKEREELMEMCNDWSLAYTCSELKLSKAAIKWLALKAKLTQ